MKTGMVKKSQKNYGFHLVSFGSLGFCLSFSLLLERWIARLDQRVSAFFGGGGTGVISSSCHGWENSYCETQSPVA